MKKYFYFFLLSVAFYSMHFYSARHGIYGDGNGYYALAHTIFFQDKLDFGPIYGYLSAFQGSSYVFSRVFWNGNPTITGVLNTPWIIGTAFFWLPSFFIIRLLSLIGFHIGMFHWLYEFGCGLTGIILVLCGLRCIELTISRDTSRKTAILVIVGIFLGSQITYYSAFEPALSHQASFFLISFLLYLINKTNKDYFIHAAMGLSMGLLAITRLGETALILLPVGSYLTSTFARDKKRYLHLIVFGVFLFAGLLPQLLLQKAMYGTFAHNPYLYAEKGIFHGLSLSSFIRHLFSPGGGFLLWSPIYIPGILGFFGHNRKHKTQIFLYLLSLLIYYILIASWEVIPPAGFGNRFFISAVPFLALGITRFFSRYPRYITLILTFAVIWNLLLLSQFYLDPNRMVKRHGLSYVNLVTGQIFVPLKAIWNFHFLIQ